MTYRESVKTVLLKTFDYKGRASRSEFWWFILFVYLLPFALGIVAAILSGPDNELPTWFIWALSAYQIIILLPILSVGVRRLHDSGNAGGWILLIFIPYIGWLVFAILEILPSEPGDNRFGPMPR